MSAVPESVSTEALRFRAADCVRQDRLAEAEAHLRQAVQSQPGCAEAQNDLGVVLRRRGRLEEAATCFRAARALQPEFLEAQRNLGLALARQGQHVEAAECFRHVLRRRPDWAEVHGNLGVALAALEKPAEALTCFRQAVSLRPDYPEGHLNLGVALAQQRQLEEAVVHYREALRLKPGLVEALQGLGAALWALGQVEEAVARLEEAVRRAPAYVEAYNELGIALRKQGKFAAAEACYQRALALRPDYAEAAMNRALLWLAQGDFRRGWPAYEARWRCHPTTPPPGPRWDGSAVAGRTLLLWCEQGLGDTVQFIRYAGLLQGRGARVLLLCPPPLLRLLANCPGIDQLLPQGRPLPAYDAQVPLLSLPGLLGTTGPAAIPAPIPYLAPEPALLERWQRYLAERPGLKVGIAWQGSPLYRGDRQRSLPLAAFAPLARLPGICLISLQKGQAATLSGLHVPPGLDEAGAFIDTAALARQLDVVICSDSAVAHVAGAVGARTWLLLPRAADWRWLADREDTPWYPQMRLFRQRRPGDWAEVFQRVVHELQSLACPDMTLATAADATMHRARGLAQLKAGQLDEAIASFRQALQCNPRSAEAHGNLGVALAEQGRLDEAVTSFRTALHWRADYAEGHHNLGVALARLRRPAEAELAFRQALRLKPDHVEALVSLGSALLEQRKLEEAATNFCQALRLRPDDRVALRSLGVARRRQGNLDEAIAHLRHLVHRSPQDVDALNDLGNTLREQGNCDEARAMYTQALRLKPDYAEVHSNLGVALADQGRPDEAFACWERALALRPDYAEAEMNRALLWLAQGDFRRGWPAYEARWRCHPGTPPPGPRWDGSDVAGRTLLLWCEQGLGDTIQFIRYAGLLQARGARVLLQCPPPLLRLLASCPGIEQLLPQGAPLPAYDAHVPLLSLPGLLGTTSPTAVPATIPYLTPEPALRQRWQDYLAERPGLKVGIAWQGSPLYRGDRQRSLPLAALAPLARLPGICLISLQKGQASHLPGMHVPPRLDEAGAFIDTAALARQLDVVICSDSAVAHVAGAVGARTWLLLPRPADWRWLGDRDDTPWYPQMRLFRQRTSGDWPEVFQRVVRELQSLLAVPLPGKRITVEISPGEALDRIAMLEAERARNPGDVALQHELAALLAACAGALESSDELTRLTTELRGVVAALADQEAALRALEIVGDFGPRCIELARSAAQLRDRQAALKRQINNLHR